VSRNSGSVNVLEAKGPVQACTGIPLPLPSPLKYRKLVARIRETTAYRILVDKSRGDPAFERDLASTVVMYYLDF
jgi:hypothetical protein